MRGQPTSPSAPAASGDTAASAASAASSAPDGGAASASCGVVASAAPKASNPWRQKRRQGAGAKKRKYEARAKYLAAKRSKYAAAGADGRREDEEGPPRGSIRAYSRGLK